MPAANILQALVPFQQLLEEILVFEQAHLQAIGAPSVLRKYIKQSYSFIELSLKQEELLYAQVIFEISQDEAVLQKVYVSDRSREQQLEASIRNNKALKDFCWTVAGAHAIQNELVVARCLAAADAIARRGVNCAHGDDYRPGCYSSVLVSDTEIILSQINHMNAKSLKHKNDYCLRNLVFTIPLIEQPIRVKLSDLQLGPMRISFSDSSSANNLRCGEAIMEQIKLEQAAYL